MAEAKQPLGNNQQKAWSPVIARPRIRAGESERRSNMARPYS